MLKTKYLYLPDLHMRGRVLSVGRQILPSNELRIAYAINKVELDTVAYAKDGYVPRILVRDRFHKKMARHIINARLLRNDRSYVFSVKAEQSYIWATLGYIANNEDWPLTAQNIAQLAMANRA